ncbi:MAG: alcohol dehydrogenase catalytic domain-containing protein [Deltaproteobacteria bacterium]|nr:alcohol dehydrogenase catalytic domain-containing protein [Deltaproteobacteria bacterium]MCX7953160.1 alcohol dehydrogenase catalytic domain-containing protein [Deltaproteobacteria bacterium]
MRAYLLTRQKKNLRKCDVPIPTMGDDQILAKVMVCGVCRTDLHIIDGELTKPKLPLILGHQVVGLVEKTGKAVKNIKKGDLVGVPWLAWTCKKCRFCRNSKENLCENALFTGYTKDGGFAQYISSWEDYTIKLPNREPFLLAPLLCGGLIGHRAYQTLRKSLLGAKIGIFGLGSSGHIITQIAVQEGYDVYVFVKRGDKNAVKLAEQVGAKWAGFSDRRPDFKLDGAIIFAPVGELVSRALEIVERGGVVVCAGIHMTDVPAFKYSILWGEKILTSVANLTRQDGQEFFAKISKLAISPKVNIYSLDQVNEALEDLKLGKITGSIVLDVSTSTGKAKK